MDEGQAWQNRAARLGLAPTIYCLPVLTSAVLTRKLLYQLSYHYCSADMSQIKACKMCIDIERYMSQIKACMYRHREVHESNQGMQNVYRHREVHESNQGMYV